ncbi:MAG: L,D-transpeptidase family protein [Gammaproteobacteria bacterium]
MLHGSKGLLKLMLALVLVAFILPAPAADFPVADRVVIDKSDRQISLWSGDTLLKRAKVALGLRPQGHKSREGDFRTPEGRYQLAERNPNSDYFLSIRVSYPAPADVRKAASLGVDPGGQIMIHGQPNKPKHNEEYYRRTDWTDGCIAVSNSDMVDIWLMTTSRTPITIRP